MVGVLHISYTGVIFFDSVKLLLMLSSSLKFINEMYPFKLNDNIINEYNLVNIM